MNDDLVTITNAFIDSGKSSKGAWNARQLRLLGVEWPPQKGWKCDIIGTKIVKEAAEQFLALRDCRSAKSRRTGV